MIPHVFKKQEDEESIVSYDYEKAKVITWYNRILLNRPLKVLLVLILASVLAPVLVYQFIFYSKSDSPPPDGFSFGSCVVRRAARIPCGSANVSETECHQQCCYDLQNNLCYHRTPSRFSYLITTDADWTEDTIMTPRINNVPYNLQPSVPTARLSVNEISATHLTLTFYDSRSMSLNGQRIQEKTYNYTISSPELNVAVYTNAPDPIFNTMRGPVIASDNIWEMAFKLTEQSMYGLGELPLEPGTVKIIYNHDGGLGSIPLIFARTNESYHGLLIDVSTPTEVSVGEDNQIWVRSITKQGLKFHLFTGPTPKDIMRDAMSMIGSQTELEYWMLGAHVCSELGLTDAEALTHLTSYITNATRSLMAFESHCGIRPLVFDPEEVATAAVANGATAVTNSRRRFVPHLSPYIRYVEEQIVPDNSSTELNDTIANFTCTNIVCEYEHMMMRLPSGANSEVYTGLAHEHAVVYPDYTSENVTDLLDSLWEYNIVLNGMLLENDWPLDESEKSFNETYEELPYFNEYFESAFKLTPQWDVRRPNGDYHLYEHNKYGTQFMEALWAKFNQTNLPTWSSSQWMRGDAVVNRQNVQTSWLSLRKELVAAALGGVSGHWLWSIPICGDTENFNMTIHANLCVKWYMAGAFFPMIKIHSKTTPRDPLAFEASHQTLMLNALNQRMSLMPYFHTVLQEGPLLRPMFYQYPFSENLVDLSNQFSVGDDLLIAPNLLPSQSHVHVYMPPGTWYEFRSGLKIDSEEGQIVTLTTTEADFITLVRGGAIVPVQRVVRDTADVTRRNTDFVLVVATERVNITNLAGDDIVETDHAVSHLRMAPNMTVHFSVQENQLTITSEGDDFDSFCGGTVAVWTNMIRNIDIYGLPDELNNFDNRRTVNILMGINMCNLRTQDSIVFALV